MRTGKIQFILLAIFLLYLGFTLLCTVAIEITNVLATPTPIRLLPVPALYL